MLEEFDTPTKRDADERQVNAWILETVQGDALRGRNNHARDDDLEGQQREEREIFESVWREGVSRRLWQLLIHQVEGIPNTILDNKEQLGVIGLIRLTR